MSHKRHTFPVKLRRTMFVCAALIAAIGTVASMYLPVANAAPCGSGCVASLSVTPGSGTYNPGNTITVSVYVNSGGQSINAVQADFTYTASRLQFQGINAAGSSFGIDASSSGGGGSVTIARGNTSGISGGSLLVAQVSFTVLSSAGAGSITFSNSSSEVNKADGQGTNILGSASGASYTVSIPTPPPTQTTQQQDPPSQPYVQPGPTPSSGTNNKPVPTSSQPASSTPQSTPETATPTTTEDPKTNTTTATDTKKSTPVKKSNAWLTPALIIGGIVVVGAGGAGAWLLLRRRHSIVPITGGSVPTSDFITGPGVAMPPVQPPITPPQNGENPNSEAGDRSDPFSRP